MVVATPGAIPGLDCSDPAQADRRKQLADMLAKMRSGVSAVGELATTISLRRIGAVETGDGSH